MEAYHVGCGYKLAEFAHQKFKTHRSLPEIRMDAIIAEMKALKISTDAPVAVAAVGDAAAAVGGGTAVAEEEDVVEEDDDGFDVEHWAMCIQCSKYRKLFNHFPRD